jgi:hypothetical protein
MKRSNEKKNKNQEEKEKEKGLWGHEKKGQQKNGNLFL